MSTEDFDTYEAIQSSIDRLYVPHSRFLKVLERTLRVIKSKMKGVPAFSLHIGGPSGVGKSAVVLKIAQEYPKVSNGRQIQLKDGRSATCDHIPVLIVEMPIAPNKDLLVRQMLKELGDEFHLTGRNREAVDRLHRYLPAVGTKVIIIDESQRAADRQGKVMQQHIGMFLQSLHDKHNVLVIIIGLGRSSALLYQDTQIVRRWANEMRLDPYEWGNPAPEYLGYEPPKDRYEFIGILHVLKEEVSLEWDPEIDFDDEAILFLFYYASRGLIGFAKKVFHAGVFVAGEDGASIITMEILDRGFDELFMSDPINHAMQRPFRKGFVPVLPPPLPDDRDQLFPPTKKTGKKGARSPSKVMRKAMLTEALTK